jgi:transposase
LDKGIDGLRPRKAPGKSSNIPADLADTIRAWIIGGPPSCGLDRANWTYLELAQHLCKTHGIRSSRSAMQRFCKKLGVRVYRPTYRYLRGDPVKQTQARTDIAELKKAKAGAIVLLSQDEARFPMVPTLAATLGVKGHRPVVGTRDDKSLLYVFGVANLTTATLSATTLASPAWAKRATGQSKTRRMQEAFAAHLRHVGRLYPQGQHARVVLLIDNAPWHQGQLVRAALEEHPQLELKRLPSYSPQLNPIERLWKALRRRATHNRLFECLAELRKSVRASLGYFQSRRGRVASLLHQPSRRQQKA